MKKLALLTMITLLSFTFADSTIDSSDITTSDLIENQSKISESTINLLKPAIDDWLQFYELNIEDFHSAQFDHSIMQENMIVYKGEFDYEYDPILYEYSPSKQKYIDHIEVTGVYKKGTKYYYAGSDDSQGIYLRDYENKTVKRVLYLDIHAFAEAAYWLNEDNFVIVGLKTENIYFIQIISNGKNMGSYEYQSTAPRPDKSYFQKYIKSRGIIEVP